MKNFSNFKDKRKWYQFLSDSVNKMLLICIFTVTVFCILRGIIGHTVFGNPIISFAIYFALYYVFQFIYNKFLKYFYNKHIVRNLD